MFSTQTSNYLDPESFFNQPASSAGLANEIIQVDTNAQADDGAVTVVTSSLHKEAGNLNETQLRVYQKFIPIKPKIENQGKYLLLTSSAFKADCA